MRIEKILVIDDEAIIRKTLTEKLNQSGYKVVSISTKTGAKHILNKDNFDLIFLDPHLSDGDGNELLEYINQLPTDTDKPLVVILTGYGSIKSAVESIKRGAFDYILKPFSLQEIDGVLKKSESYNQLSRVNRFYSNNSDYEGKLLGESKEIQQVRSLIKKVATTEATVLITGENGTGKELVAHEVYRQSHLSDKPYIAVNCAAISADLIESEFFGHEKGAFTNAINRRTGRFELANNGTIFLDEIGEIPFHLQSKLLRILQERSFERVGGMQTINVNIRVIASTNRDMLQAIKNGTFREDLFYRLNVFPIETPPLRTRKDDILLLANFFFDRYVRKYGVKTAGFSEDANISMLNYRWPGNVRELQNCIERAIILIDPGCQITSKLLNIPSMNK